MVDEAVVTEHVARIAASLAARASELTSVMVGVYEKDVPRLLRDDEPTVALLASSVQQNVETALQIFQHGIDVSQVEAPVAALQYARRLAQRGTPLVDLIRAYHVGQTAVLDMALQEAARQIDDSEVLGAMARRVLTVTYAFIDRVINQVVTAYEQERDRWLSTRSAMRAARVRAVLEGDAVDVDASEAALGYRLRGTHLGLVAWRAEPRRAEGSLTELERLAAAVAEAAGGAGRPLFVPCDEASAWVWLPLAEPVLPAREVFERAVADTGGGIRVAVGEPGRELAGFRRTHRQALRVQALGLAAGPECDPVMCFAEVGSVALMVSDIDSARAWVADTLGALATDDAHHARLRETLRVFLAEGSSYTAAAARLVMHKNSVQYRVRKAEELLGRDIAANRLDVELALTLCRWLGSAVLSSR
ncbi:PucR family transcriptional regulator [Gandjariella thermophila]|uniref:ABC transporter substrate-binding protein n=1 Tax=Gandjariella thermophila TaxID=1931992 RepID=A0A4D4JBY7_9PSEU|nr:helix-turn-helix domain-containing protein [Gandjariella thermophila]GDY31956.1 ABC transporter substrate-binding protein [Gandjariella thermophila]